MDELSHFEFLAKIPYKSLQKESKKMKVRNSKIGSSDLVYRVLLSSCVLPRCVSLETCQSFSFCSPNSRARAHPSEFVKHIGKKHWRGWRRAILPGRPLNVCSSSHSKSQRLDWPKVSVGMHQGKRRESLCFRR